MTWPLRSCYPRLWIGLGLHGALTFTLLHQPHSGELTDQPTPVPPEEPLLKLTFPQDVSSHLLGGAQVPQENPSSPNLQVILTVHQHPTGTGTHTFTHTHTHSHTLTLTHTQ